MSILDRHVLPLINDLALGERVTALRQRVVGGARGRVLEVGAGTGLNFPCYREDARVVAIDPSTGMRQRAAVRVVCPDIRARIEVAYGKAEALPFDDGSFDEVVVTFVLCSVRSVDAVLAEVRRVLRPAGLLRLIEHVRSPDPAVARWQERVRPAWKVLLGGCDPTIDLWPLLDRTGFAVDGLEPVVLPLTWLARPGVAGTAVRR